MTVRENLEFALRRHGKHKSKDEVLSLVKETLNDVGLANAIDLMPSELSGGMRKRIGLARSLILHPEIMLYDEPTTGLDPITSGEIINLMLNVQKKYNTSAIIISHDMHCARLTANRLSVIVTLPVLWRAKVIVNGVNYKQGTFEEVKNFNDPQTHPFFE